MFYICQEKISQKMTSNIQVHASGFLGKNDRVAKMVKNELKYWSSKWGTGETWGGERATKTMWQKVKSNI